MGLTQAETDFIVETNNKLGIHPIPLEIIQWVMIGIVTPTLLLRLYVRKFILNAVGMDDYLLVACWATYMIYAGAVVTMLRLVQDPGPITALDHLIRGAITAIAGYLSEKVFVKMALGAFYLRVVHVKWQRSVIYYSVGFFAVFTTIPFFIDIFQCGVPRPKNFLVPKDCPLRWNVVGPIAYLAAASNAIVDWILTIIPICVIAQLQMRKKDKISACALIGLGSISSVISVVRIPYMNRLKLTGDLTFFANLIQIGYLSTLEMSIAMIAMNVSAYRPLWHKERRPTADRHSFDPKRYGYAKSGNVIITPIIPSRTGPSWKESRPDGALESGLDDCHELVIRQDAFKPGFDTYELEKTSSL